MLLLGIMPLAGGCEHLAMTVFGAPPYGGLMAGTVYDSRTGLAIGGATVIADWAPATVSDHEGRFALPNLLPAGTVTVARAGYVTLTRQGIALTDHPDVWLEPRFATNGTGTSRGIGLSGTVMTGDGKPAANAFLTYTAGANTNAKTDATGRYGMLLRLPAGNVASGMLGGGLTVSGADGGGGKPLQFSAFAYRPVTLGPGDPTTTPANANQNLTLQPLGGTIGLSLGTQPLPNLQVEAALDFGLLGQILVHRSVGAGLSAIPVPRNGLQYQVSAILADDTGANQSTAAARVQGGGQVSLSFLDPPQILAPAHQATGVGSLPKFSWRAVPGAALYAVDVYQDKSDAKPVWTALTDRTTAAFPYIPQNLNDAALKRSGDPANPLFYTWSVTALEATAADAILTRAGSGITVGRESIARNREFAL